jgi:hypothetical protein
MNIYTRAWKINEKKAKNSYNNVYEENDDSNSYNK